MISVDDENRKETVFLSQLSQIHIEKAISEYPFRHFYAKNIRFQLQKMYELVVDKDGDLDMIIGRKIGLALSVMHENGNLEIVQGKVTNHGILYERK